MDGSGEEELLVSAGETMGAFLDDWSHDRRFLGYHVNLPATIDLWLLPLLGGSTPRPFLQTRFRKYSMKFSPDSKTVAYVSNGSGDFEVYVSAINNLRSRRRAAETPPRSFSCRYTSRFSREDRRRRVCLHLRLGSPRRQRNTGRAGMR